MAIKGVTYWLLALATAVCSGGVGWTNICFNIDALLCIASKKFTKRPNPFWSCFKILESFFLHPQSLKNAHISPHGQGFWITYRIAVKNIRDSYSFCECLNCRKFHIVSAIYFYLLQKLNYCCGNYSMEEIIFKSILCIIQRFISHWSKN